MTAMSVLSADAPLAALTDWKSIDWKKAVAHVRRLQMRIAKAYREGKHGKAKALQWILTHSFSAKLLAVKRVVQNKGAKTPGVDNVLWNTPTQKMQAVYSLNRCGYKTQPLRRIYISKKQKGKYRPLSIPTLSCRAQQALHLLSLEPIAETMADKNAYGFRPLRSTADAIERCFKILVRKNFAQYILEADIKSCFDNISSQWLQNNVLIDKKMLGKWLAAGYMEKGKLFPTADGVSQGSPLSPTLLNVTLSGLEKAIKAATKMRDKVNLCVYADDFIVTGATQEILENKVKPAVERFLNERGLSLSKEKTKITPIDKGFDFLGINIRKYNGKLIMKPAKSSVKNFLADIRETIKRHRTAKTENLIYLLNPKIRGWANYYRHVCSKKTFSYVDNRIFQMLGRWAVRRHPSKSGKWIKQKYFTSYQFKNWIFFAKVKDEENVSFNLKLTEASKIPIKRHVKIQAEATPFDSRYHEYFDRRISKRLSERNSKQEPDWWLMLVEFADTGKEGR